MPVFAQEDDNSYGFVGAQQTEGPAHPATYAPDTPATVAAAFRQNNTVVNFASLMQQQAELAGSTPDANFNPFPLIKGTKYEAQHADAFLGAFDEHEVNAIKARIDQEESDREILQASGGYGTVAGIAAGMIDPTIFIPGGAIARGAKGGIAIGRSALNAALAGAGAMALSEGVLQANQYTRTAEESAMAIGTGAILSGFLGGGAAALLSRGERRALEKAFDLDRASIGSDMAVAAGTLSAAAADVRTLKPVGYGLDKIPVINKIVENMSPTMRAFSSPALSTRRATADLLETAVRFTDNLEGIATTHGGPPVSRLIAMTRAKSEIQIGDALKYAFMRHRYGEEGGSHLKAVVSDISGRTPEGKMSFADFKKGITEALQNGDVHAVPEVQEMAQLVRKEVLDPLKERAQKAGLLSEDIDGPAGDPSWFARVWNHEAIVKGRNEFKKKVTGWLEGEQGRKASAQERLTAHSDEIDRIADSRTRIEAQLQSLDRSEVQLKGRLSERTIEINRTGSRIGALSERAGIVAEHASDLEEFIGAMKQEVKDPALLERIADLEAEAKALRRQDAKSTMTEADLAKVEQIEAKGILSDDVTKTAVDMVLGKRASVKEPSFAHWMARQGGVVDVGGDLRAALGSNGVVPGLMSRKGIDLDAWGERIMDRFNLHERPNPDQVLRWIEDSVRGRQPEFWLSSHSEKTLKDLEATRYAAILEEAMHHAGYAPGSKEDWAKFIRGEGANPRTLADLDKALAEMEAAGEAIPVSVRLEGAEGKLNVAREEVTALRDAIATATKRRQSLAQRQKVVGGKIDEAALAGRANRGRLGLLEDRAATNARKRELLMEAQRLGNEAEASIMAKIEEELKGWGGKSAADAVAAIRARDKGAIGRAPDAPRLTGADKPMLRAMRRIVESDRNLSLDELGARANEIIDRILGSPDGRLPYDDPSFSGGAAAPASDDGLRGSFKNRDFAIPTNLVREFVENDFDEVMKTINRTLIPDLAITERFGDVHMTEAFRKINDEYAKLTEAATTEKELTSLRKRQERDIADLAAQRDTLRGTYGKTGNPRWLGRTSAAIKNLTTMTHLGGAALNSLPDIGGAVFRHGFMNVFKDSWMPMFSGMLKVSKVSGEMRAQARAMGIAVETELGLRTHQLNDLFEGKGATPWERGLQYGAQYSQVANLLGPWTDLAKTGAFMAAANDAFRGMEKVVAGTAKTKDIAKLAEAGIDAPMAKRIWNEVNGEGGHNLVDGVMVPNSGAWKDRQAALAFEAAMGREADIAVVTPGAERPLWIRGPVGSVVGQFKSFISATHERMLIANLQRADADTLQGLLFTVGAGMLSYRLYTWASGTEASDKPQDWVKEGLSRSGALGWFDEINSQTSKLTRGRGDAFALIGANKPLSRYESRSILSSIAGPFSGQIEKMAQVSGSAASGEWTSADTRAARRLLPFQNLFYIRRLLDEAERGINNGFSIPEPAPKAKK